MNVLDTIERMVLDLMVKGVIDSKELRPTFEGIRGKLSEIANFDELLDSVGNLLATPADSLEMSSKYQEALRLLDELGSNVRDHLKTTLSIDDIPDHLTYNAKTDPAVVESFQLEIAEIFEKLEHDLLLLERSPKSEDIISVVMGHLHSIKGIAGFLDLASIQKLAHNAESALGVGLQHKSVSSETCDALLRTKDMCSNLVDTLRSHLSNKRRSFPKLPPTYPLLFKELVKLGTYTHSSTTTASQGPKSLAESAAMEASFLAASGSFSAESTKEIAAKTEDSAEPNSVKCDVEYEEYTAEDLNNVFGNLINEAEQVASAALNSSTIEEVESAQTESFSAKNKLFESSDNVRIKLSKLEMVLDLIGEVVIAHSQLVHDPALSGIQNLDLERKLAHLTKSTRNLQSLGMSLRVFPVQQLFTPLSRTVRDLAMKLKKDVMVTRIGENAELDKSVLQALSDPLMHMVRNAVDHGLEAPAERRKIGKPQQGQIKLKAENDGGSIRIEIADDGRGLNREKILKKAQRLGLVENGSNLTDEEVWQFIFAPGFSTAASVSEVSGRGVGLDVVQRSIVRLGGYIQVKSIKGEGSVFTLILPLTLAMIEGLLVDVGDQKYIVPRSTVGEVLRPRRDQVNTVHGHGELLTLRGESMPLIRLHEFLHVKAKKEAPWNALTLVIKSALSPFALMVDAVSGQQQVVLKNLGDSLASQRGIGGCAILGDGRVGLVLNPEDVRSYVNNATIHEVV